MTKFKAGDLVQWSKKGSIIKGKVAAVVPGGKSPLECINLSELRDQKIKPLGLIRTHDPREKESYLVEVECMLGKKSIRAILWPSASLLTKAA